jgi:hypothetical protein
MQLQLGRKYRINCAESCHDGRVGVLESTINGEAWLMVGGKLARVPAVCLTDKNVLQVDLTHLLVRPPHLIENSDREAYA